MIAAIQLYAAAKVSFCISLCPFLARIVCFDFRVSFAWFISGNNRKLGFEWRVALGILHYRLASLQCFRGHRQMGCAGKSKNWTNLTERLKSGGLKMAAAHAAFFIPTCHLISCQGLVRRMPASIPTPRLSFQSSILSRNVKPAVSTRRSKSSIISMAQGNHVVSLYFFNILLGHVG